MSTSLPGDDADLTRKQRREQARTQRKELEQAEASRAARRKRLSLLGIVGAGVIAVIVIILIATGGNSSTKAASKGSEKATTAQAEVNKLLAGIPQKGAVLGNPNAPVTLKYFGDLECPVCKEFTLGALPSLIAGYVREGKLKIEYNSMETATREPETFKNQQVAALAAGQQDKMWHYLELFYHDQGEEDSGYVTEKFLQGLAEQVPGLNLSKWTNERSNAALSEQVTNDGQTASTNGFTGTPSFLVGKSGGQLEKLEYTSLTDPASFDAAIEKAMKS